MFFEKFDFLFYFLDFQFYFFVCLTHHTVKSHAQILVRVRASFGYALRVCPMSSALFEIEYGLRQKCTVIIKSCLICLHNL